MTILLVRLRLIGDVVFTTPAIAALQRRFPSARLTYVVEPSAAPVVAHHPDLHDVLVVPHVRGWDRVRDDFRLARRLRAQHFDLAIDFHGGPRSAWLTWASGATRRVGYDITGRAWMYTDVVHRPRGLHPRHSVENQWDLLAAVDPAFAGGADPTRDRCVMVAPPEVHAAIGQRLAANGITDAARLVVMHLSAGNPFRRWPETAFADVAAGLVRQFPDVHIWLTAGPSDRAAVTRVMALCAARAGEAQARIHDTEDLSLLHLRAALDRAAAYIGGDSGPLHVASTSDVPVVAVFGPTLAERSMPWRPPTLRAEAVVPGPLPCRPCDQRVCAPGDFRCLTSISAEAVLAAARRVLEPAA